MITHIFGKTAALGAMLLANATADAGCAPEGGASPGQPGAVKVCDMHVSKRPWLFTARPDGEIRASVWVSCDKQPQSHNLEIWLERDVIAGSTWMIQGDIVREKLIPDQSGFERTVRFPGCISSKWRVTARAQGIGPSGTPYDFKLPDSETRPTDIKCPGPR